MAIIAINPHKVAPYTLLQDMGEPKTIFQLGVIDSLARAYLDDMHLEMRKGNENENEKSLEDIALHDKYIWFVRLGLKGWSNFKDEQGNEIPFETEDVTLPRIGKRTVVKEDCMKRLDLLHIVELGIQIVNNNRVTEQDVKN